MDLFTTKIDQSKQHPIFQKILDKVYAPERALLSEWAVGHKDEDGKFVQEFQTTFESSLWELYLNAATKAWGMKADITVASPDFVITAPTRFCIEATIAAPPQGGKPAFGYAASDIPDDFSEFNRAASLRICNSFSAKVKRYREYYTNLPHVAGHPFVIAIAAFDRPLAHLAAGRPVIAAMYGLYHDEAATARDADKVVSYNVSAAAKTETVNVPLGLFCDDTFADVSAVIFSSLATWGKVRALADNPSANTVYTTFHPRETDLYAEIRRALKRDYREHLFDGMYVLHNPFATRPILPGVLSHPRLAEIRVAPDGELIIHAPDDFLLVRTLITFGSRVEAEKEMRKPLAAPRGTAPQKS
jgi:hypothetical protein